jgi:hypothetical protein
MADGDASSTELTKEVLHVMYQVRERREMHTKFLSKN